MAASLGQAFKRRWWIAITAILENLLFAAVLLGWSSLLLMLKNEGFYAHLCYEDDEYLPSKEELISGNGNFSTSSVENLYNSTDAPSYNDSNSHNVTEIRHTPAGWRTCLEQDEMLNRYFSIGSSLLSAVTIFLGFIMDRYGSRMIRICGSICFMVSCVLFAIGSTNPNDLSGMMAPAVCLNGMGGITYIFTSFPIPNFFANLRSTMIALMIGSYSASAVVYMIFKAMYDSGMSFQFLMILHGAIAFLTFINALINQPGVPIPGPGDLSYAISLKEKQKALKYDKKTEENMDQTDRIGRRLSEADHEPSDNKTESHDLEKNEKKKTEVEKSEEPAQTFMQVLMTPCYWFSVVTMCLTQLRLIAYMGWLELYVKSSSEKLGYDDEKSDELVSYYAQLFGILQINCFFMAPVIGQIMDWNLKGKKGKTKAMVEDSEDVQMKQLDQGRTIRDENGNGPHGMRRNIKRQQITNLFRAFFTTNLLLFIFGIIVQIDTNLPLQIVAFVLHTIVRTFLHSSTGGLYACMFHFSHFGKLTGLTSFLGAVFILIQDPLFVFINNSLGGNPYWVNFGMLVFTLSGFGLPLTLWFEARKHSKYEQIAANSSEKFCISDDGSTENLFPGDAGHDAAVADDEDITVSKGALTF